ncbi:MAG: transglutaminase domain-containing protein [Rectinemataceae bacterium]|nr:transglutaminase domain-containing protein [Rectinemataceae bacterium]
MKKWKSLRWIAAAGMMLLSFSCATARTPHGQTYKSEKPIRWENTLFAWNSVIDYTMPSQYLAAGPLTGLSAENRALVESTLSWDIIEDKSWSLVDGIYRYLLDEENFSPINADGAMIAKRSADRIFAEKTLTGCHDWGIVLAATLRAFGIPAIYIDAASVAWAVKYTSAEKASPFFVHVFIEAWIDDRWVLLNSTKPEAIIRHDVTTSLIEFRVNDNSPYYVMFKGLDPLDYGLRSAKDMRASMSAASETVAKGADLPPATHPLLSVAVLARKKRVIAKAIDQRQF